MHLLIFHALAAHEKKWQLSNWEDCLMYMHAMKSVSDQPRKSRPCSTFGFVRTYPFLDISTSNYSHRSLLNLTVLCLTSDLIKYKNEYKCTVPISTLKVF